MAFAIAPPVPPMLAKRVAMIPDQGSWIFEPKWDGFRVVVFRDYDELLLQSRDGKSLNRYFPELLESLREQLPERYIFDGEIVISRGGALDFDALQLRVHPAASRVTLLSQQIPASVVFFDALSVRGVSLMGVPFEQRRHELEGALSRAREPLHLTPATRDIGIAADWFQRFEGAGLDGVMAKQSGGVYEPDKRAMLKIKHERDCDCVVAGFRWHKQAEGTAIGSLLLGLFDHAGELQHVGVCASFTQEKRQKLVGYLAQYRLEAGEVHPWVNQQQQLDNDGTQRIPGGQSRWSQGKDLSWIPLRPVLVAEVAYEHMQGDRFRHLAHFRRWRSDKQPAECTYEQLQVVSPQELSEIFPSRL